MSTVREQLEQLLERGDTDEQRQHEAGRLLIELITLEGKAHRLMGSGSDCASPRETGSLRGLTLHAAAYRVLDEAGRPLHVRELGSQIKARGWKHPRSKAARSDQIFYQLASRLPRHAEFERVGPNTFGLSEWHGRSAVREKPHTGLFRGPGGTTARSTGDSEAAVTDEVAAWRSS